MFEVTQMLDPTAEGGPTKRARLAPPASLEGKTVAILDIGKSRGDVFIDQLATTLGGRGVTVKKYAKPTNTKVAPTPLLQDIAENCDLVIEALSD